MKDNYMARVAEMFGLKLGEEFEVKYNDGLFKFDEHYVMHTDKYGVWRMDNDALGEILSGDCEIIKKPWKPKCGERYFYISIRDEHIYIYENEWEDTSTDYELYHTGNFFRTEEEARKNREAYREFVESLTPNMSWRID